MILPRYLDCATQQMMRFNTHYKRVRLESLDTVVSLGDFCVQRPKTDPLVLPLTTAILNHV